MILGCPNNACEGDTDSLLVDRDPLNTMKWFGCIHCDWCGMSGPTGNSEADAKELWNDLPRGTVADLAATKWYRGTDTGISSETIFEVMTGYPVRSHSPPADSGDFGRCYRLLDKFPEWKDRMGEVADRFPNWKPLVDNWGTLESMYRARADGMYAYMNGLMNR